MPEEIKKVLVLGSGPIVIGQAAEFDYAGSQACRALREEGVEVVLVNSNPATIMTDRETADKVYIEPMDLEHLEAVIAKERPDSILPTLGGQTGLNLATQLWQAGIPQKYGMRVIGTGFESIQLAEDRDKFKATMAKLGMPVPLSYIASGFEEAMAIADRMSFPLIIRPGFTLGGTGGGIAFNRKEFADIATTGLLQSLNDQILVEECVVGWKEIEYEVMRDADDNCITVCNMENIDPMGVHTGDSIVVAPSLTLTDVEYQMLRSASLTIIRGLGIEGGCNVQFALNPNELQFYVIEVNPRVSRSSALASKATGYPIARVAAKIALGKRLHEIVNQVTGQTMASFEPALDYVVLKIPKWPFDKFRKADRRLGTQMKATGEVMSIDRTFEGAFLKALAGLEVKLKSFRTNRWKGVSDRDLHTFLAEPTDGRIFALFEALYRGYSPDHLHRLTGISQYFIEKFVHILELERRLREAGSMLDPQLLPELKRYGITDELAALILDVDISQLSIIRHQLKAEPGYKSVDTCAAEFAAQSPYFYSSYATQSDKPAAKCAPGSKGKVLVLGSGPIRIGQGIEFDYCSVHALIALQELGYEAVIVNNNPETVSTDFDVSDGLYFEPLSFESVREVIKREEPLGVVCQFGGQTAINLAAPLDSAGIKVLGITSRAIDQTEDREQFDALMERLNIPRPPGGTVLDYDHAVDIAHEIRFPVLVRPSFVLGGRAMQVIYTTDDLKVYIRENEHAFAGQPLLIDKFYRGKEVEVDVVSDGENVIIPGIMEHIERAGIHSGDSMAVYPPQTLTDSCKQKIVEYSTSIARAINAQGLINIQFVVDGEDNVFVIEVNPRASRTVPFISKITGVPMIRLAMRAVMGGSLADCGWPLGLQQPSSLVAVKAPVFSFQKLRDLDVDLGPEMKSTGEVMGIAASYPIALRKALVASGISVPSAAQCQKIGLLATIANADKEDAVDLIQGFARLGFVIYSTAGSAAYFQEQGIETVAVKKLSEGRPNIVDNILDRKFSLVINTVSENQKAEAEARLIRREAVEHNIPVITSLETARALLQAISIGDEDEVSVTELGEVLQFAGSAFSAAV
ncbi:MAG TPA: carbamoyl-phosphate synthase large subunit [Firmicutes bacterium]|nr:carbamoyl-phosphate synthase large subunit [Bacillota bacterium]